MRVLIDCTHPAHVHFFREPIGLLRAGGASVTVTSRRKEIAQPLLDGLGIEHVPLEGEGRGGLWSLGSELVRRDVALWRLVGRLRPQVMSAIGGIFAAHAGALAGVPSVVFYDTENARLQNALTYPLASCVVVPRCYRGPVPRRRHVRYPGYHELSYLHPVRFRPRREIALRNGAAEDGDTYFIRLISWKASHDTGASGWDDRLLQRVVKYLASQGRVMISSERRLPRELEAFRYAGRIEDVHHVLAYCRAYMGESATMASECAVLGVPAIYTDPVGRGYTDEQEQRYGLVKNLRHWDWPSIESAIDDVMETPPERRAEQRQRLLDETIDVAAFVARCVEDPSGTMQAYQAAATD